MKPQLRKTVLVGIPLILLSVVAAGAAIYFSDRFTVRRGINQALNGESLKYQFELKREMIVPQPDSLQYNHTASIFNGSAVMKGGERFLDGKASDRYNSEETDQYSLRVLTDRDNRYFSSDLIEKETLIDIGEKEWVKLDSSIYQDTTSLRENGTSFISAFYNSSDLLDIRAVTETIKDYRYTTEQKNRKEIRVVYHLKLIESETILKKLKIDPESERGLKISEGATISLTTSRTGEIKSITVSLPHYTYKEDSSNRSLTIKIDDVKKGGEINIESVEDKSIGYMEYLYAINLPLLPNGINESILKSKPQLLFVEADGSIRLVATQINNPKWVNERIDGYLKSEQIQYSHFIVPVLRKVPGEVEFDTYIESFLCAHEQMKGYDFYNALSIYRGDLGIEAKPGLSDFSYELIKSKVAANPGTIHLDNFNSCVDNRKYKDLKEKYINRGKEIYEKAGVELESTYRYMILQTSKGEILHVNSSYSTEKLDQLQSNIDSSIK